MEDTTGTMDVMIFGDQAQELIGAAAKELVGEVTGEMISAVLCSHQSHSFVIAAANGCFVVKHILNDKRAHWFSSGGSRMRPSPVGGRGLFYIL